MMMLHIGAQDIGGNLKVIPLAGSGNRYIGVDNNGQVQAMTTPSLTDTYLSSASFATGTGVLSLTLNNATIVTVNLDGRYSLTNHSHTLDDLSDVNTTGISTGQGLYFNGTSWVAHTFASGTTGKIGKFTGQYTLGDSVMTESSGTIQFLSGLYSSTGNPALDINGSYIRIGDGLGAQSISGMGIKFHDAGAAHVSLLVSGSNFSIGKSSSVSTLTPFDSSFTAFSVETSNGNTIVGGTTTTTSHLLFATDNSADIGATAANRPRYIYLGSHMYMQAGGGYIFSGTEIIAGGDGSGYYLANGATPVAKPVYLGSSTNTRLQIGPSLITFGGSSSTFPALKRNGAGFLVRLADDSGYTTIQGGSYWSQGHVGLTSTGQLKFSSGSDASTSADVGLIRNAAGQLKVTDSNTGWGSIYASAHVTNGGTSSHFVKGDGSLDSSAYLTSTTAGALYVPYNGHVTRSAPFGQLALTHQLVNNVLYSAASRFTVTTNLNGAGATTLTSNTLFNGFYDQQAFVIPSGQNAVFEIEFTSKGGPAYGIVYPGGYIRLHYYSNVGTPTVTGTLTYQNTTTTSLTFTNVGQGIYTVNHAAVPGTNYVTKMSITVTNPGGSSIGLAQIEYFMTREGQYETGLLNKFEDNTRWTNLTMKDSTANTTTIFKQASTGRQYMYSAPVATPALGQFMMGAGPWDGSSAGYFRGHANGTWMAINTISSTANFLDFQYNQSTGTGHRWSVGYNGAVSWTTTTNGAVSAGASISYASHLRISANNSTKIETSGLNVGATDINLSAGQAVIQSSLSVGAAASVLSGATLSLGTASSSSTASPVVLSMGGTFSSSAGANPKLRLYDDGTPSNTYGIGVSAGQLDYVVPNATHNFYANGTKTVEIKGGEEVMRWSHSNGNYAGFYVGNGSAIAAGAAGLYLNGSPYYTMSGGQNVWYVSTHRVASAANQFVITGGGNPASSLMTSILLGSNAVSGGQFTATSGTQTTVSIGSETNAIWAPTSGTATYNILHLNPRINTTGTYAGTVRGLYIETGLTAATSGTAIRAIESTLGDWVMGGAGYATTMAMNGTGLYIGHNSASRSLILQTNSTDRLTIAGTGAITASGTFTATSLIKSGGTSSQFLKADGSVDSNTYLTSASLSGYVPYTGATASLNLGSWNFSNTGSITGGTFSHSTGNNLFNSTGGQFQIGSTSTTGSFTFEPANPAFEIIRHSTLDIVTLQPTYLSFKQGANNFSVFISSQTLTTNRNIAFPNQSGTIALTSDITSSVSGYVPYTGASTNLNLGANNLSTTGTITVGGAAAVFNSGSVVLSNTTTTDVLAINKANFRALFVEYVIYFVNSQLVGSFMVSNASGTVELGGHQVTAEIGTIPTHTITVTSDATNAIVRVSQFSISGYTMKMIYRYI
jgi:hypothetical protein